MLDKCANPACSAKFLRLHDGRLFGTDLRGDGKNNTSCAEGQLQYFWLCRSCCRTMTVAVEKGKGLTLFRSLTLQLQLGQLREAARESINAATNSSVR